MKRKKEKCRRKEYKYETETMKEIIEEKEILDDRQEYCSLSSRCGSQYLSYGL